MSSQRGNTRKAGAKHHNLIAYDHNRGVKCSQGEMIYRKELSRVVDHGVCPRCAEKMAWRFKYGKYKELTRPVQCKECKQCKIRLAYRTLCDPCAKSSQRCPACCEYKSEEAKQAAKLKSLMRKCGIDSDDDERAGESAAGSGAAEATAAAAATTTSGAAVPASDDLSALLDDLEAEETKEEHGDADDDDSEWETDEDA